VPRNVFVGGGRGSRVADFIPLGKNFPILTLARRRGRGLRYPRKNEQTSFEMFAVIAMLDKHKNEDRASRLPFFFDRNVILRRHECNYSINSTFDASPPPLPLPIRAFDEH